MFRQSESVPYKASLVKSWEGAILHKVQPEPFQVPGPLCLDLGSCIAPLFPAFSRKECVIVSSHSPFCRSASSKLCLWLLKHNCLSSSGTPDGEIWREIWLYFLFLGDSHVMSRGICWVCRSLRTQSWQRTKNSTSPRLTSRSLHLLYIFQMEKPSWRKNSSGLSLSLPSPSFQWSNARKDPVLLPRSVCLNSPICLRYHLTYLQQGKTMAISSQ